MGSLTLAHEIIYFPDGNGFEMEIGPYFSFADGKLDICPMFGSYMNLSSGETEYLLPQLYFYSSMDKLYFEAWNIYGHGVLASTKDYPYFYGRYYATYSLTDWLAIGPQVELTMDLSDDAEESLASLQFGGAISFPTYGENNSILVFLGVDNKADNHMVSRFTFVRYF